MYKNQLQELAQRSCFTLPAYTCLREGPDHAPRFKASVSFNGETFETPGFCSTLRQAEHAAAEVALTALSRRGPSPAISARMLDETGVCKNLLQEAAQRAGASLPAYTTIRSGPGHIPTFRCIVHVAGLTFVGDAAKTKKQAEKNAAMAALPSLKVNDHCPKPGYVGDEPHSSEASAMIRKRGRASYGRERSHKDGNSVVRSQLQLDGGISWPLLRPSSSSEPPLILPRAASAASRGVAAIAGSTRAMAAGGMRTLPSSSRPFDEQLKDEEEWLRGDSSKSYTRFWPSLTIRGLPSSSPCELNLPTQENCKDGEWFHGDPASGGMQREGCSYPRLWASPRTGGQPSSQSEMKVVEKDLVDEEWVHGELSKHVLQRQGTGSSLRVWSSPRLRGLPYKVKPSLEDHVKDEGGQPCRGSLEREETWPYTLGVWPPAPSSDTSWGSQAASAAGYASILPPFHPVSSVAPPVRVREVAILCSAPPPRARNRSAPIRKDGPDADPEDCCVLQKLSQLRL